MESEIDDRKREARVREGMRRQEEEDTDANEKRTRIFSSSITIDWSSDAYRDGSSFQRARRFPFSRYSNPSARSGDIAARKLTTERKGGEGERRERERKRGGGAGDEEKGEEEEYERERESDRGKCKGREREREKTARRINWIARNRVRACISHQSAFAPEAL